MYNLKAFLLVNLCCYVSAAIKINTVSIPDDVKHDQTEELILDCDYSFEPDDASSLVVKWFFPDSQQLLYQWIPTPDNSGVPHVLGRLKSHVEKYEVTSDPLTRYRALRIKKITPELTGNYTCLISSDKSEDRAEKKMVVYKPADKIEFIHLDKSDMYLCAAYGMFPKPTMNIYVKGSNLTKLEDGDYNEMNDVESNEDDQDTVDESNGLFNVTSSFKYIKSEIMQTTEFICELKIPDTNYHEVRSSMYYKENGSSTVELNCALLGSLLLLVYKLF